MTAPAVERPGLAGMTEGELAEVISSGTDGERAAAIAELDQRDAARRRAGAARARVRERHGDWEAAAYANYLAAEEHCRGNLLSARGRASGRDPWPMLWMGGEETARRLASEELLGFWDYGQARPPGPAAFARGQRGGITGDGYEDTEAPTMTGTTGEVAQPYQTAKVAAFAAQARQRAAALRGQEAPQGGTGTVARAEGPRAGVGRPGAAGTVATRDGAALRRPGSGAMSAAPAPVDGDRVLKQVYGYFGHMAVWPSQAAQITATLYTGAPHAVFDKETAPEPWQVGLPVFTYFPRLFYTSAEGGSGKSWMSRLTGSLCPNPKRLAEMTKASYIDLVARRATVIVTELDVLVGTGKRTQWLTGLANVGYEYDGMTSRKQGGEVREIPLFGPVILDGLDKVIHSTGLSLKTLMSRCIIVRVTRAPDGYRPPRYDREHRAVAAALSGRLGRWMAAEVKDGLADRVPQVPEHLGNRPFDLWEPLFAVAEAAGGDWPALARYACEYIESEAGLPSGEEEDAAAARIDSFLDEWDAPVPALDMEG